MCHFSLFKTLIPFYTYCLNCIPLHNYDMLMLFKLLNVLNSRKIKIDMAVNQEELKILRLSKAILVDDELTAEENYLNDKQKRLDEAKVFV